MTSHYTLYDVIWIAHVIFVLQWDVFLHCDLKKKKNTVINTYLSYILAWNDLKPLNSRI